jgi:hypothetical protein
MSLAEFRFQFPHPKIIYVKAIALSGFTPSRPTRKLWLCPPAPKLAVQLNNQASPDQRRAMGQPVEGRFGCGWSIDLVETRNLLGFLHVLKAFRY